MNEKTISQTVLSHLLAAPSLTSASGKPYLIVLSRPTRPPRKAAAPVYLTPDAWSRVQAALSALGTDPAARDVMAAEQVQAAQFAAARQNRYAVKVAQRQALIARVEAAALRGEVDAANSAWDKTVLGTNFLTS